MYAYIYEQDPLLIPLCSHAIKPVLSGEVLEQNFCYL